MSLTCPVCGAANRAGSRFCSACATPLTQDRTCPACGTVNTPTANFCNQCATPLVAGARPPNLGTGLLRPQEMLGGRYVIVGRVGQGGMGAVYRATDARLGQKVVALKEMSDAAITDELDKQQARHAFEQEAQMLARLDHRNLPRVTDHFSDSGKLFLVMDYVEGQTLAELAEQAGGPLAEEQVLDYAIQLCKVLEYLHSQQPPIIFRDLKPSNVMVDPNGGIKLIDFGIARFFKPGKRADTLSFGTVGYAAPEQYGKGQTDERSDIYALGAMLHNLLTLRDPAEKPFHFPPVRELNASVSPSLEGVVTKAVEPNSDNRWQSVVEMREALEKVKVGPPAKAPQKPTRTPKSVPQGVAPSSQFDSTDEVIRTLIIFGLLVLLALAALGLLG